MNWLDRDNPLAGGAELHFFEIFKRLVGSGDSVTLVSSGFPGAAEEANIDGIAVHRFGGRHSFALRGRGAVRRLLKQGQYDVVVEDINKLPLFLPNLTDLPFYAIIPHLFGTTAFREVSWPVAMVVWAAERPIPRVYRRAAFHAISESTRDDLVDRGVPSDSIRVVYPGTDTQRYRPPSTRRRASEPTFLYLGRLKRYKGVDLVIRSMVQVRRSHPAAKLLIVGDGDDRDRLERLAGSLGLEQTVRFCGFVPEAEKVAMLQEAWALVFPSAKEGWGLTNVEAAACGTPAIASDSPGIRESVRDGETGILVPHGDISALSSAMLSLADDVNRVEVLGRAGPAFAAGLTWDAAAEQTREHLLETVRNGGS